jgi:hypothetical protein
VRIDRSGTQLVIAVGMFAVAGFAFGPVFPDVILLGGRIQVGRMP